MKVLILNGPGLADLNGSEAYAGITLKAIEGACAQLCGTLGWDLDFRQTDDAQQIAVWLAEAQGEVDALVLNPQAFQGPVQPEHRQAIENALDNQVPAIEVHLAHVLAGSVAAAKPLRPINCNLGFICGLGIQSYLLAIKALHRQLQPHGEIVSP